MILDALYKARASGATLEARSFYREVKRDIEVSLLRQSSLVFLLNALFTVRALQPRRCPPMKSRPIFFQSF